MNLRDKLLIGAVNIAAAILAALLARWGLDVKPPVITPDNQPPGITAPPKAEPKPDPLAAIVKISRSGVGCSGTVIGPRRADGRYWVLSAAHCCSRVGERWQARFRDGRTTGLVVTAMNKTSDYAWMLTDVDHAAFPFAELADADPEPGAKVWHAGYGVDVPGNREDGEVAAGRNGEGQIEFVLSVSSGDSGGGICLDSSGKVISPVCCTTDPGKRGHVWGCSPVIARRGQVIAQDVDQWEPIPIPTRMPSK